MYGEFDNIKICGIASAAPKTVIDNEQVAETLGNRRCKKAGGPDWDQTQTCYGKRTVGSRS